MAIQQNRPGIRVVETEEQIGERGLIAPAPTDKGNGLLGRDGEIDIPHHGSIAVGERDIAKFQPGFDLRRQDCAGPFDERFKTGRFTAGSTARFQLADGQDLRVAG